MNDARLAREKLLFGGAMHSSITNIKRLTVVLFAVSTCLLAADPIFLRRQVADVKPQPDDLTANAKQVS